MSRAIHRASSRGNTVWASEFYCIDWGIFLFTKNYKLIQKLNIILVCISSIVLLYLLEVYQDVHGQNLS